MHLPATSAALLFAYAFLSNIALAVVPHEPGATVWVPAWAMVVLFVLLMVPSLRLVAWPRAAS